MEGRVDVSVVIPARNGADTIGAQLESLAAQRTSCTWELIVADNGSTDRTAAIVHAHPVAAIAHTRVVDAGSTPGFNIARNAGVAAATGRIVLLCDCDDVTEPTWVESYWLALRDAPSSVAAGPVDVTRLNEPHIAEWGLGLGAAERTSTGCEFGWGGNMGVHREVWIAIGGLDESIGRGFNDIDLFARAAAAGIPFTWIATPPVHYRLSAKRRVLLAKAFHHGRALVPFSRMHPDFGIATPQPSVTLTTTAKMLARLPGRAFTDRAGAKQLVRSIAYQLGMLTGLVTERAPACRRSSPG